MVNYWLRFRQPMYLYNMSFLKRFGVPDDDDLCAYRLTVCKCVRNKGELPDGVYKKKNSVNDVKLADNLTRARSKIREYGLCNPWEMFVTLTLNKENGDRYDIQTFKKTLAQWIRDENKKYKCNIKYLLIPEKHQDGAWHFHGFLMGIPPDCLTAFTLDDNLPKYIRDRLEQGETVYNWPAYANKFGWCIVDPIRKREAAVHYLMKYITKDLDRSVSELGAHLYYASQGLQKAVEIKRGTMAATIVPDWENEHCKVAWFHRHSQSENELKALFL